jgi:hypothetical protein
MARFRLSYTLILSLLTLSLGAVGCSNGSSPTEPAFDSLEAPLAATSSSTDSSVVSDGGDKRGGDDDDDNSGSGSGSTRSNDDNDDDDNDNNRRRRGRGNGGNDDDNGDDRGRRRGGRGADDRPRNDQPRNGAEFEARVLSVSGNTLNLAGGTRVLVNGATQWSARGDLFNLGQVSAAVAANRPVRAEGRGIRQGNGSFVAQTLKVEVDD